MLKETIPNFALAPYGEETGWDIPEPMHYDELFNRSNLYGWNIAPHRHDSLYQIFMLTKGEVVTSIDGRETKCVAPTLVFVPPMTVHGFKYKENSDGHVLTILDTAFDSFLSHSPDLQARFKGPFVISRDLTPGQSEEIDRVFEEMAQEFHNSKPGGLQALHALTSQILVKLARTKSFFLGSTIDKGGSEAAIASRFIEAVDEHYTEHQGNEFYASLLGISEAKLIRVSNSVIGMPPKKVITNRVILEAKRSLVYTSLTCAQIGHFLGFDDPAYFSRYFKRNTGKSPADYRKEVAV